MVIKNKKKLLNRSVLIDDKGNIKTFYDKIHMYDAKLSKSEKYFESKTFKAGKNIKVVKLPWGKLGLSICYDLRFPVWSRNTNEYDLLVYVANWPSIRIHAWDTLLKARAIENMSYCIGVNRVGEDENGYEYNGHTVIYNFLGEKLSSTIEGKENMLQCVVSKNKLRKIRKKLNFLQDQDAFKIEK